MKTLLISNRKGGVGKTTTAINLAANMAKEGQRVLLIDLDTQSHLQYGLGFQKRFAKGIRQALRDKDMTDVIQSSNFENLSIAPADINFDTSSLDISKKRLKKLLKQKEIKEHFDLCIIDTPPTSDSMLNNAMFASDFVIVPMQSEYLS